MPSALDAFRAQRDAADQVHARLTEVAQLLERLTRQVDVVASNPEFRAVLRGEQAWLREAHELLRDVRHFRDQQEQRFWPRAWRSWVLAVTFALASAVTTGAVYEWQQSPSLSEIQSLRDRAELADAVSARIANMTSTERRQFNHLMRWSVAR
jgi:hypothetical protein